MVEVNRKAANDTSMELKDRIILKLKDMLDKGELAFDFSSGKDKTVFYYKNWNKFYEF